MSRLSALAVSLALFGCGHTQQEGVYTLTEDRLIRDDCRMAETPGLPGTLDLLVVGDTVRLEYSGFEMQLVGSFLAGMEGFSADGSSANVAAVVNGKQCLLDQITTHLDATAPNDQSFAGSLAIRFEAQSESCRCELWMSYSAQFTGGQP